MKTGVMANRHIKLVIPVLNYTNYDKEDTIKNISKLLTPPGALLVDFVA